MILSFYVVSYHIKCLSLFCTQLSELSLLVRLHPKRRNYGKGSLSAHFSNIYDHHHHGHIVALEEANWRKFPPSSGPRSWLWVPAVSGLMVGWVQTAKNNLSPASQAKGTRLCVSVEGGREESAPIHRSGMWRCCVGLLGATGHAWLGGPVERVEVN